ncbi:MULTISPECIES: SLAC1 anion channel family protein [Thiomicrorhabdus]|uniref:C4-dicarboxylate ABC transporter n=1 Tax=Thiomicrorhabdus xiamenensis TaxID=2739063 RepID=A0A7D4SJL7_9GAMM|nr:MULTISPECIES: SLAC1 anion channel family protein [Thiomicrorhabdus]MBO1923416.1 SLAC1 anion channel family protein [Thiomicrorhabdus sp. 6S3-12]QKI90179.1 C4-dicarboxylate ABC transporter [Thiomicrorhabdus xiamenensis]
MNDRIQSIAYLPASFFGMIMGVTGLSIAFLHLSKSVPSFSSVATYNVAIAVILMVILGLAYLFKVVRFFPEVKAEMKHPIKMNFIPAISISLLLLSIAFYALGLSGISKWLWVIGAVSQISLTYWVLYNWVHHDFFTPEHSNPAWFIPIVGNIIVPIAGVHHAPLELNWFFFSVGLVFWIVVKSVLVNRIIFHAPMQERLIPTLFIFIAPPAVGFISYLALNDQQLNQFAMILYFFGLAMTALMLVSIHKFAKLPFALSWWAFTFPVAAIVIASYVMAAQTGHGTYQYIGYVLHALLTVLILYLVYKTLMAVKHRKICVDH